MVLGTSVIFSSSVWQENQSFKDDYDLIYDADKGVFDSRKIRGVFQHKEVIVEKNQKEISQDDVPEGPPKVIFNHNEMVYAKRLTFVPGHPAPGLKPGPAQSAEDYNLADKDEDVNSLVIGEEEEEEDDDDIDDEYQYWKENPNPEFKNGDFDKAAAQKKLPFKYSVGSEDKKSEGNNMQVVPPNVMENIPEKNIDVVPVNNDAVTNTHVVSRGDSQQDRGLKFERLKSTLCEQFGNCSEGRMQMPQLPLPHLQAKKMLQQTDPILPNYVVAEGGSSNRSGEIPKEEEDSSHVGQQLGLPDSNHGQEAEENGVNSVPETVMNTRGFQVVRDKIYWSLAVEDFVPKGRLFCYYIYILINMHACS